MKAGFYSPMPPAATGVADYSAALFARLRRLGDVELDAASCDLALYHLGNNSLHQPIYERALAHPGVVVLHDAVLNHFYLGLHDEPLYIEEFVFNYGEWNRALARELWRNRARSGADPRYFAHPMLKRIATRSRSIIVHNPAAAAAVQQHAPGVHVCEIPHLFLNPPKPSSEDVLQLRESLDVSPATLLLGAFGHQRETKRLGVVLRAFRQATGAGADAKLLIAGRFASEPYERALAPDLAHPRILRTGYLAGPDFWRHAAACDAFLNLRYPTAGETSGIAISMMGIGKPVIFTAGEEISRFPENACLCVPIGPGEEKTLAEYIVWLAANPQARRQIGLRAAEHIAREHDADCAARSYWEAMRRALNSSPPAAR
jgi:glycosyltransferase involved in cell wall biosynthesis